MLEVWIDISRVFFFFLNRIDAVIKSIQNEVFQSLKQEHWGTSHFC